MNTIQIPTYVFTAVCAAIVLLAAALVCLILRRKEKTSENAENKDKTPLTDIDSQRCESFISTVSHELRTPLTIIGGKAQLVISGGDAITEEKRKELCTDIVSEVDRLSRLISTIRRQGELKATEEPLDIAYCLNKIKRNFEILCERNSIRLEMQSPESALALFGNDEFMQILTILCDNAIKFTPKDGSGKITLQIMGADDASALFREHKLYFSNPNFNANDEKRMYIFVKNNGGIVNDETKKHMFEKFYTSGSAGGTGLGLSIAAELVASVGGSMLVISDDTVGTLIGFALKSISPEEAEAY